MTWSVPLALEDAVYTAARAVVGEAPLAAAALARAVIDRSKRYTSERDRLAAPSDRTADLAARAAFFTIADAPKPAIPLGELTGRGALPARPLRIVDLGAGCGAMTLGAMVAIADRALDVIAIDRDVDALRIAGAAVRGLAAQLGKDVAITTRAADATATAIPPADLILIGTLLNELPADARLPIVTRALASLADDGALVIIEPALRDTARALHELRDAVLAAAAAHVFAPCTRRCAPCTALADPSDWCHEDRAVTLPPRTAELARTTHLRDAGLKFAYLVLRKQPLPLVEQPGAWRVVSAQHAQKGKLELIGCGDAGRPTLRLLRRNRSAANRPFERADRGDVLVVDGAIEDGRLEIAEAAQVERIEPAKR